MSDVGVSGLERLDAWLSANVQGYRGPATLDKFAGGQSNPTYRLDAPSGPLVLRRKPSGTVLPSAHAVEREHRILTALHPLGFPVPRPIALCRDEQVIGSTFYVMELVEGRSFIDGPLPGMDPGGRERTYHAMTDTLAALHRIDPVEAGLGDFGRKDGYCARQVERWTRQYRLTETENLPAMERMIDWLPSSLPRQEGFAIVHGDFRIDNVIFAADEPRILAVLDWELSTLGDPLADLAYFLLNWLPGRDARSAVAHRDLAAHGIPPLEDLAGRYCEATGRTSIPDLSWYFAFNFFRLAAIVQGIRKRVAQGNASSARAAEISGKVPELADSACAWARKSHI